MRLLYGFWGASGIKHTHTLCMKAMTEKLQQQSVKPCPKGKSVSRWSLMASV